MEQMGFEVKDKKILVVGLGRSGIAACYALADKGAKIYVQDSKKESDIEPELLKFLKNAGAECYFGREPETAGLDAVVLSPGVNPELGFVRKAADEGAEIIGELELAYRLGKASM